jgi:hypothetical protein
MKTPCQKQCAAIALMIVVGLSLLGCGAGVPNCSTVLALRVAPASATVNHAAASNAQQFAAQSAPKAESGCPLPQFVALVPATWSVSDPTDVSIGATTGIAVCKAPTKGAVTVTAVTGAGATAQAATASLLCQ